MKKSALHAYARLIVRAGGNVRKGQEVMVFAQLDQPAFVYMMVEECYKAGASKVMVEWDYQPLTKLHVRHRSLNVLSKVEPWEVAKWAHRVKTLPVSIYLISEDPDGLAGVNPSKHAKGHQARLQVIKPYRDEMENKYQWCIAAVPGKAWAKKIFPDLHVSKAVEKLWEAILFTCRVGNDSMKAWEEHDRDLQSRCQYLNGLGLDSLHYTSSNGTDLTVGLIPQARFMAAGEYSLQGIYFNANMPTEEVFISPMRGKAEGIVYATKPLSYQGQLIENFSITFQDGKVTKVKAEKNENLLKEMIGMDEGAAMLGECAFVPYDSPIRETGLLFYNTLFDENAASHLALGRGFSNCLKDYGNYTTAEAREMGINDSLIHVD
ncbi:MAG TPA: peptidase M29, partial [Clostridiales bacterium]|nr:peptidase M29 [Clostridiales bacterium]